MFYAYVLRSQINEDLYIGYSDNLRKRFSQHNQKKVKSTKGYIPWMLIYYEAYDDKKDAIKREKQLKRHKAKEDLKIQIEHSLGALAKG